MSEKLITVICDKCKKAHEVRLSVYNRGKNRKFYHKACWNDVAKHQRFVLSNT